MTHNRIRSRPSAGPSARARALRTGLGLLAAVLAVRCGPAAVSDGIQPVSGCTSNSECPSGFACVAGACRQAQSCAGPEDCAADEFCDAETVSCRPALPDGGSALASDAGTNRPDAGAASPDAGGCTADTWASFAQSSFSTNCSSCHSFVSTYSGVSSRASKIRSKLASGAMPPEGGLGQSERDRLVRWLDCGLPR